MSNFTQTFKNIDDLLYKDSGADSEIDYIEQSSWILFLRYLESWNRTKKIRQPWKEKNINTYSKKNSAGVVGQNPNRKTVWQVTILK